MSIKLETLAFFRDLPAADRVYLFEKFERILLDHDRMVFSQGDSATWLYILLEGKVKISFNPHDGEPMTVSEIAAGGVFGWSAVLGHRKYTSSAISVTHSEALRISGDALRKVTSERPDIGVILLESLAAVIADRLKNTHSQVIKLISDGLQRGSEEPMPHLTHSKG
jgi:CRP-like cAMP-binding protein